MTDRLRIERELQRFIVEELLDQPFDGRDPLEAQYIDSLGLEQLSQYVAEEFGVKLSDEEMAGEAFESIAGLAALVERRREAARA